MAFGLSFIAACALFIPFMIKDGGYFLFYGDFNVQQIPFYKMCHDAVRSGNIFWNWNHRPWRKLYKLIFVLLIRQPVFLADHIHSLAGWIRI